ncbi:MAG: YggS family pyridoxal phosphate-dependent enzyme [Firmicutes bacterium]|nr:YggS family pyridoxal phosphate-dependent enzyme [Bacillota bacterium]
MDIAHNLEIVRRNINQAALKSGRQPSEIKLVAVTKQVEVTRIEEAIRLGITALGENQVQELVDKYRKITAPVEWHLIGTLQTNKVKYILDKVRLIHSLDRWALAEEISRRAIRLGKEISVLIQVNVAGEATKHGLEVAVTEEFIQEVANLPGLKVLGLMTMAPQVNDPEEVRPVFRELRQLAARIAGRQLKGVAMDWLSMGMTNDYLVAIEEGANLVRIGTGIFGERNQKGETKRE